MRNDMPTNIDPEILDAVNAIIRIVRIHKTVTQRAVARMLGVDSVLFEASWLIAKKRLVKVGGGRGSKWTIIAA